MASLTITQGNVRATATTWAWPLGVRWGTSVVTERLTTRRRWWCFWRPPAPTWEETAVTSIAINGATFDMASGTATTMPNTNFNGTSRASIALGSTHINWIVGHRSRVVVTPGPMGAGEAPFTLVMNSV